MTIWDTIYQNKQKISDTWATPSERLTPFLQHFLDQSKFETRHALDIGCGTGFFLKLLQTAGFKTDGIDSSETAVEMTKKLLGDDSPIVCADMFEYEIPKNKYDLIICILTIHHGTKEQIQNLINKIHKAIKKNGKIFITLPDFENSKKWNSFKDHEEVTPGTYIPLNGIEKGLPHSFYTKEELIKLFSKFKNLELDIDDQENWIIKASK